MKTKLIYILVVVFILGVFISFNNNSNDYKYICNPKEQKAPKTTNEWTINELGNYEITITNKEKIKEIEGNATNTTTIQYEVSTNNE